MINLFVSYFTTKDEIRQGEINRCLMTNIANNKIDRVFIVVEQGEECLLPVDEDKVRTIAIRKRPTYSTFFNLVRKYSDNDDWNIIANSDIYFDETIDLINSFDANDCLALCRWECATGQFLNRRDSQDVWIVKGHPRNVQAEFTMGTPGCDNAIADRFAKVGYNVISPSKSIKTWHLHSTDERTYNLNHRVPQPYKFMEHYT